VRPGLQDRDVVEAGRVNIETTRLHLESIPPLLAARIVAGRRTPKDLWQYTRSGGLSLGHREPEIRGRGDRNQSNLDAAGSPCVRSQMVIMHQGDESTGGGPNACNIQPGRPTLIAQHVSPSVDAIFTGHTHQQYNCVIDDPAGSGLTSSARSGPGPGPHPRGPGRW
jgi:hypothetical protein